MENNCESTIEEIKKFCKTQKNLSEILVLRTIFDLIDFETKNSKNKWIGIEEKENQFLIPLEFFAARVGYYFWRPTFYFESDTFFDRIDQEIYDILKEFEGNKGRKLGKHKPKISIFCAEKEKSNIEARVKIREKLVQDYTLRKVKKKCNIFEILENTNQIIIEKQVITDIKKNREIWLRMLDELFSKYFSKQNSLFSSIKIMPERSTNISDIEFMKIQKIQDGLCFYCKVNPGNIKEHVIPEEFVTKTTSSNIVGACKKCNRDKWVFLPSYEKFELVLKRNDENRDIMEKEYSQIEYNERYNKIKKIIRTW